jgi:hypothetical protein
LPKGRARAAAQPSATSTASTSWRRQAPPGDPQGHQAHVRAKIGKDNPFDLVFHCDSGSSDQEIADAVSYGMIKMNIDTDTQYAYTRPVADHMFKSYDGVLKVDGEVGNKKTYDPATGAPPPKPDWPAGSSKLPSNSVQPERPSRTHTAH